MKCCVVLVSLAVVLATSQEAPVSEEKSEESGDKLLDSGERHRRSGDVIGYISSKLAPKISAFASASAGISSLSSEPKPEYGPPAEEAKSFDIWAFKKALLSTLLQAAKAIKGGLIAIKGQIIKAKGHFLSAKGRYISAKGEAISNFGKQVASTALNLDAAKEHSPHPSAPSHPTAHSAGYLSGLTGSSGKAEITVRHSNS
ncbi:hypothetical protein L798_08753 [Zootermopsis nevadensis]|uniref:Uncharacterized protein n=1 Tax=Zootermopsis nevadensis TaxID=136037 RepID=A0A067R226_ZOONE|nr:hypothetical protein L798_08753 [Zootermopsis nevadensis]